MANLDPRTTPTLDGDPHRTPGRVPRLAPAPEPTGSALVIEDLDHTVPATPAWTYCG
jgi:hypothetical protein